MEQGAPAIRSRHSHARKSAARKTCLGGILTTDTNLEPHRILELYAMRD